MLKKITNTNIQNYLYENNYFPVDYDDTGAEYYKQSPQLFDLLDKYYIKFVIFQSKVS